MSVMRKLAVIFPGIGYNKDKPLLYYSAKIAVQNGYEIIYCRFNLPADKDIKNRETLLEFMGMVAAQAEDQLKGVDFTEYSSVLFISKSIGTVAASIYAQKHILSVIQIYFTPLEQTFSLVQKENGLVFFGEADPFAHVEVIRQKCLDNHIELTLYKSANHSLETGDTIADLEILNETLQKINDLIEGTPIYRFKVLERSGKLCSLADFRAKVLLIINSATGCGFTPQYDAIEALYQKYHRDGFEVLDFPCNQFLNQAPGSSEEIHSFCRSRYNISFPQFAKIDVNGESESELFKYLKSKQGFKGFCMNSKLSTYMERIVKEKDPDYAIKPDIKWNFTKFLIDRQGRVIKRFEPDEEMSVIEQAIKEIL